MTNVKKTLATLAATAVATTALAGAVACGLTGKTLKQCCCQQKNGKLVCTETGQDLDQCCCTPQPGK